MSGDSLLGVPIVRAPDPASAAAELAAELDAELVTDEDAAERAFAARTEAGRTEPVALDARELAELRANADEMRAILDSPALPEETISELRRLADELGRAERIRGRTEDALTESLTRRMSSGSSVAIHPSSLRDAAAAVTNSDANVQAAHERLSELGDEPVAQTMRTPAPVVDDLPEMLDEAALERRRWGLLAVAIGFSLVGAAVILLAFPDVPVAVPSVLLLLGLGGALVVVWFGRRQHEESVAASQTASALAAADAHVTSVGRHAAEAHETHSRWLSARHGLQVTADRAVENARSARRHWESLAGLNADPYDVETVLRARDPQYQLLGAATNASPTVRTANALHRKSVARWRIAWAALGHTEPPTVEEADVLLARLGRLADDDDRAATEAALERLSAAEAWVAAGAIIDRPLVLVEPSRWLAESRLEALLLALPAGAHATIVEATA